MSRKKHSLMDLKGLGKDLPSVDAKNHVNALRDEWDSPLNMKCKIRKRKCLKCKRRFKSAHFRLCDKCHRDNEHMGRLAESEHKMRCVESFKL